MKASELIKSFTVKNEFQEVNWTGAFDEYLDVFQKNPLIARNAYQRLYDMIVSAGSHEITKHRNKVTHWDFFQDIQDGGKDAIFGLGEQLNTVVNLLRGASLGYGVEKRILLLKGPVGSAKSTIARLLKKGLERYSRTPEGALYTFQWKMEDGSWEDCPMHEEPLKLIPEEFKNEYIQKLTGGSTLRYPITTHLGDLDAACRKHFNLAMQEYNGDWHEMIKNCIRVKRLLISEKDRMGIGTYQPKDEKSQDATELTGDINFRKISIYGSDSDPRAFNFDGEFNVANRGLIEFIEVLKLEVAFLYDLLSASQERKIKPRKFAQTDIDEVIIGHTNMPEVRRLQSNELMEAFKDRTISVNIGYPLELEEEIKVYEKDFKKTKKHLAPHTLRVASMWAILTRLVDCNSRITLMQKLKLYNGKTLPGFTSDNVEELRSEGKEKDEGMFGISPRFIQDKISNVLASDKYTHVNPFIIMNEIEEGLNNHTLISSAELKTKYKNLLAFVKDEYTDIVKNEVQRAICADEEAIARLCGNYVDNVKAYCQKEKMKNKYTGHEEEPDEQLMRSVEEKIDIPANRKEDFRRECLNYIGALAIEGKKFQYWANERLHKALELKLFEDSRHTIKLNTLLTNVVDAETQKKIDVVKTRLITNFGYNEESATDILNYVASIFTRGDPAKKD